MQYLISILIVMMTFTSCRKVIDFEEEEIDPKIVVNSMFYEDSIPLISLVVSQSVLEDEEFTPIVNADVQLKNTLNGVVENMIHIGNGQYKGDSILVGGVEYEVLVNATNFKAATGNTLVPHRIDNLQLDTMNLFDNKLKVSFQSATSETYYEVFVTAIDTFGYASSLFSNSTSPIFKDGFSFDDNTAYGIRFLFSNADYLNNTIEMNFSFYEELSNYDSLKVTLNTLSRDAYLYEKTVDAYFYSQDDPFAQPVQVYSNVNGGLGVVSGKAIFEKIIEL